MPLFGLSQIHAVWRGGNLQLDSKNPHTVRSAPASALRPDSLCQHRRHLSGRRQRKIGSGELDQIDSAWWGFVRGTGRPGRPRRRVVTARAGSHHSTARDFSKAWRVTNAPMLNVPLPMIRDESFIFRSIHFPDWVQTRFWCFSSALVVTDLYLGFRNMIPLFTHQQLSLSVSSFHNLCYVAIGLAQTSWTLSISIYTVKFKFQ